MTQFKHSELTFNLIVEASPCAIMLVNSKGNVAYLNHYAEKLFQYEKKDLIGRKLEIFIPDKYRYGHPSLMKSYLLNPVSRRMGANKKLSAVKKDKTEFPVEIGLNPIVTANETFVLATIIDITERVNFEKILQTKTIQIEKQNKQLKKSEEQLKELNATKDKFLSIIAHDLKNPFNIIMGYSDLLCSQYDSFSDTYRKEYIEEISNVSKAAYTLLENLLTWARSQQGGIKIKKEVVNLDAFLQESIAPYVSLSKKKNINIKIDVTKEQTIFADRYTMNVVVGNIVNNAIKFTNEGGLVNIEYRSNTEYTELLVRDSGIGMSNEQINKLFRIEENISTLGTNSEEGTGLGLILCKEFTEKNGGHIHIESETGKGSTFIISLPAHIKE